jgi:tetraacyldisaccharide 4'-kinase
MLRSHGMQVIEHAFRDHARLTDGDLHFGDDFEVLMTEKDAVKFQRVSSDKFWAVRVDLKIDALLVGPWLEQIESRLRNELQIQ